AGAAPVRELNGKAADAAGCPVDEYVLPRLDSGAPKEALPCSEGGNGCDRRGHVIDRCRLASDVLDPSEAVLCLGPVTEPIIHAVDRSPHADPGHSLAQRCQLS